MQYGFQYNMQAAYRLCQLWLDLKGEEEANKTMQKVFDEVPSLACVDVKLHNICNCILHCALS
jgi:hypothetical protein